MARPERPRRGVRTRQPVDIEIALGTLVEHRVDFVVIGGFAAIAHGSQRLTQDLDLVADPGVRNSRRLIAALIELEAEYRLSSGRWVELRANVDPGWLVSDNHLFDTRAGGIDVFYRLEGVPTWKEVRPRAVEVDAFGHTILVLDKDMLIKSKLAAGREQDLADVAELTAPE